MTKPIIIIGSGLAGYNLAREIRQHDKNIALTMITQDNGAFYSKPMLSTALSMGKTPESLISMDAEKMAAQYNMTILSNKYVEKVMPENNCIVIENKVLEYTSLVFCTGADTHQPYLDGDAADDILQVNDVYQYHTFREKIKDKKTVTLLGAGLVGCEFANDLTQAGYSVHMIEAATSPISSLLPETVGLELKAALEKQGVHWHLNKKAKTVTRHQDGYELSLEDHSTIRSDIIFSAIGLKPRIELAKQAGIQTHRGILVDTFLKTNMANIYAMGDCAEINHWILPYIAPIMQCAKTLGATLCNKKTELSLPAMPVVIKTSCYSIVICRPPFAVEATWHFENSDGILRGYLKDTADKLYGFVLTKGAIKERMTLAQSLEKWL